LSPRTPDPNRRQGQEGSGCHDGPEPSWVNALPFGSSLVLAHDLRADPAALRDLQSLRRCPCANRGQVFPGPRRPGWLSLSYAAASFDERQERLPQPGLIRRGEVDLITLAVEAEGHGLGIRRSVEVVGDNNADCLCHLLRNPHSSDSGANRCKGLRKDRSRASTRMACHLAYTIPCPGGCGVQLLHAVIHCDWQSQVIPHLASPPQSSSEASGRESRITNSIELEAGNVHSCFAGSPGYIATWRTTGKRRRDTGA